MIKYTVKTTSQFKKDYKLILKQNKKINILKNVVAILANGETLPEEYKDHALSGNWRGHRECHILPDWLLVYKLEDDVLILTLSLEQVHTVIYFKEKTTQFITKVA